MGIYRKQIQEPEFYNFEYDFSLQEHDEKMGWDILVLALQYYFFWFLMMILLYGCVIGIMVFYRHKKIASASSPTFNYSSSESGISPTMFDDSDLYPIINYKNEIRPYYLNRMDGNRISSLKLPDVQPISGKQRYTVK